MPCRLHWLHKCQLTQQQQDLYTQGQKAPSRSMPIKHTRPSQIDPSAKEMPDHSSSLSRTSSRQCDGQYSKQCRPSEQNPPTWPPNHIVTHPPTLSPVWLPIRQFAVTGLHSSQEDELQQAAKRPRFSCDTGSHQDQQRLLPVPPLRFFIQSAAEITLVYLPGK